MACCRFGGHRDKAVSPNVGHQCQDGSSPASSSLRRRFRASKWVPEAKSCRFPGVLVEVGLQGCQARAKALTSSRSKSNLAGNHPGPGFGIVEIERGGDRHGSAHQLRLNFVRYRMAGWFTRCRGQVGVCASDAQEGTWGWPARTPSPRSRALGRCQTSSQFIDDFRDGLHLPRLSDAMPGAPDGLPCLAVTVQV